MATSVSWMAPTSLTTQAKPILHRLALTAAKCTGRSILTPIRTTETSLHGASNMQNHGHGGRSHFPENGLGNRPSSRPPRSFGQGSRTRPHLRLVLETSLCICSKKRPYPRGVAGSDAGILRRLAGQELFERGR